MLGSYVLKVIVRLRKLWIKILDGLMKKKIDNNIAYRNETCKKISKKIRAMKNIDDEYVIGEKSYAENF